MTTNQTIDGVLVSPELLRNLVEPGMGGRITDAEWEYLRSLLDAPINPLSELEVLRSAVKELEAMRDARVDAKLAQPQGELVAHTMKSVMEAICSIDGFPMLTSNQCHALAMKLNGIG